MRGPRRRRRRCLSSLLFIPCLKFPLTIRSTLVRRVPWNMDHASRIMDHRSNLFWNSCINRAILVNLQLRPLKRGRLKVYRKHTYGFKNMFQWQLTLLQSPLTWFQYVSDFQLANYWMRPQTGCNIFICLLDRAYEAPFVHIKMEHQRWTETPLIFGKSGTQYGTMVTKLLHS